MFVLFNDEAGVPAVKNGVFVAGAGGDQASGGDGQDAQPDGDEHAVLVALAEAVVDVAEDVSGAGVVAGLGHIFDQGLGDDHE